METARPIEEPKPSAAEQRALERLRKGQGGPASAQAARLLVDRCGRYGCAYAKPSKASPGTEECPGWCDALDLYDKQRAMRAAASGDAESKAGKLARDERAAIQALENEQVSTKDVLALIFLTERCANGGCAESGEAEEPCPGWCAIAYEAWDRWWAR